MIKPVRYTEDMVKEYLSKGYWQPYMGYDYCKRNAELYPHKEALVDFKTRLTWHEVKELVDRIATAMTELDIKPGESIALLSYNCAELYLIRIACEKAGIILIQLLPTLRHKEVQYILSHANAAVVIISERYHTTNFFNMIQEIRSDIPSVRNVIVLGDEVPPGHISFNEVIKSAQVERYSEDYFNKVRIHAAGVNIIASTTGTTGVPKLVEHAGAPRQCTARVLNERCKYTSDDIHGVFLPILVLLKWFTGYG